MHVDRSADVAVFGDTIDVNGLDPGTAVRTMLKAIDPRWLDTTFNEVQGARLIAAEWDSPPKPNHTRQSTYELGEVNYDHRGGTARPVGRARSRCC